MLAFSFRHSHNTSSVYHETRNLSIYPANVSTKTHRLFFKKAASFCKKTALSIDFLAKIRYTYREYNQTDFKPMRFRILFGYTSAKERSGIYDRNQCQRTNA